MAEQKELVEYVVNINRTIEYTWGIEARDEDEAQRMAEELVDDLLDGKPGALAKLEETHEDFEVEDIEEA